MDIKLILVVFILSSCLSSKKQDVKRIEAEPGKKITGVYWRENNPQFVYRDRSPIEKPDTIRYSIILKKSEVIYMVYER